jgi:hypothetical protein
VFILKLPPHADNEFGENQRVTVTRIAWLVTVVALLLTALLLLLSGYQGYAGLGLAVAASAAINLR